MSDAYTASLSILATNSDSCGLVIDTDLYNIEVGARKKV